MLIKMLMISLRSLTVIFFIATAITRRFKSCVNKFYGIVNLRVIFFRTLAKVSFSFITKIVLTAHRNRRWSIKPAAGIVMLLHW